MPPAKVAEAKWARGLQQQGKGWSLGFQVKGKRQSMTICTSQEEAAVVYDLASIWANVSKGRKPESCTYYNFAVLWYPAHIISKMKQLEDFAAVKACVNALVQDGTIRSLVPFYGAGTRYSMRSTDPWVAQPHQELCINSRGIHIFTGECWKCVQMEDVESFGGSGQALQLTFRASVNVPADRSRPGAMQAYHFRSRHASALLAELRSVCSRLLAAGAGHVPQDLGTAIEQQAGGGDSGLYDCEDEEQEAEVAGAGKGSAAWQSSSSGREATPPGCLLPQPYIVPQQQPCWEVAQEELELFTGFANSTLELSGSIPSGASEETHEPGLLAPGSGGPAAPAGKRKGSPAEVRSHARAEGMPAAAAWPHSGSSGALVGCDGQERPSRRPRRSGAAAAAADGRGNDASPRPRGSGAARGRLLPLKKEEQAEGGDGEEGTCGMALAVQPPAEQQLAQRSGRNGREQHLRATAERSQQEQQMLVLQQQQQLAAMQSQAQLQMAAVAAMAQQMQQQPGGGGLQAPLIMPCMLPMHLAVQGATPAAAAAAMQEQMAQMAAAAAAAMAGNNGFGQHQGMSGLPGGAVPMPFIMAPAPCSLPVPAGMTVHNMQAMTAAQPQAMMFHPHPMAAAAAAAVCMANHTAAAAAAAAAPSKSSRTGRKK